jgi:arsenite-transporting ATPase
VTTTILVTGAGGVGKTTVAAALGVATARQGMQTLVATVDPAKRLADALGVGRLSNTPAANANEPHLHAAMLDAGASWDAIAYRHTSSDVADRLVANPLFHAVATQFPSGQAYAAAEEMLTHIESGRWEVLIVDTPPAAGGIEFFQAPAAMRELVGGRLLRWLTGARLPGRVGFFNFAARPALRLADALLGGPLLEQVAEFLFDLRSIYDGITATAARIEAEFTAATSLVVTTADPAALREAMRFADLGVDPALIIFNRALPVEWAIPAEPITGSRHTAVLNANLERWASESRRQRDARAEFGGRFGTPIATVPWMAQAPTDIDALARLLSSSEGIGMELLGLA